MLNMSLQQRKAVFIVLAVAIVAGFILITRLGSGSSSEDTATTATTNTALNTNNEDGGIGAGDNPDLLTAKDTAIGFVETAYTTTWEDTTDEWLTAVQEYTTGSINKDVWALNPFHPKAPMGNAFRVKKASMSLTDVEATQSTATETFNERQKFIVKGVLNLNIEESTRTVKSGFALLITVTAVGESWRVVGAETVGQYRH